MLSSPTAESKLLHCRHGMWSLRSMDGANTSSQQAAEKLVEAGQLLAREPQAMQLR
jgi:hypothetical protein